VITLSLLHPVKQIPAQVWKFENESVIRIGRSTDNHVILYSAVVSRHHVELRRVGANWEIVNLGTNGTYLEGKRITQVPATDGAVIRLARSGPNIKIRLGAENGDDPPTTGLVSDRTVGQPASDLPQVPTEITRSGRENAPDSPNAETEIHRPSPASKAIPVPPHLQLPDTSP
jgi:hypothetical protein